MNGLGTFCGTTGILLPAGLLIWGLKLKQYSSFSSILLPAAIALLFIFNKDSSVGQTCLLLAWIWTSTFSFSPSLLSITVPSVLSDDLLNILMISTQDVTIDYAHWISSLLLDAESPFSSTFCFFWLTGLLLPATDQSFGSSHQLICEPDFSSPLPLHASLDFIMDSRHISVYSLPWGLSDDWIWHKLLLNAQWLHSIHNCIVQIILFLCKFLDLFHFSSSYCLLFSSLSYQ